MFNETGTTLATQAIASSTCNEQPHAERDVKAIEVIGWTVVLMMARSILPTLLPLLQVVFEEHTGLNFLHSMFAELLSQIAGLYASVPEKKRITGEKIAKLDEQTRFFILTDGQC